MMKSRTCDITRYLLDSGQIHAWAIENLLKRKPEALPGLIKGIVICFLELLQISGFVSYNKRK